MREIAVRLGTSVGYVSDCERAYNTVPAPYRADLEITPGTTKVAPGKISMKTARAIMNAEKNYRLPKPAVTKLYEAAKTSDKFQEKNINKYAAALLNGSKRFIEEADGVKVVNIALVITEIRI